MPAARSIPRQYPDGCAGSRSRVGHLKRRTMDLEPEIARLSTRMDFSRITGGEAEA